MEVSFNAVDWEELTKFENTGKFEDWMLELEDEPSWLKFGYNAGWTNNSASFYCAISDGLEKLNGSLSDETWSLVEQSLLVILTGACERSRQDFPCDPESCYFLTLSPQTVKDVRQKLGKLDFAPVIGPLSELVSKEWEVDDTKALKGEIEKYFSQVNEFIEYASSRRWGIIGHMG